MTTMMNVPQTHVPNSGMFGGLVTAAMPQMPSLTPASSRLQAATTLSSHHQHQLTSGQLGLGHVGGGRLIGGSVSSSGCDSPDSPQTRAPTQGHNPGGSNRKRRRGVIEKRRRDRINSSLNELRRLVPSAFEKQGSQKLEKAEILQLTVEYLRGLNSKGMDSLLYETQRQAVDYHSMGYRECASEVARFLSSIEGLDLQDPIRMRLLGHLQSFITQKISHAQSAYNNCSSSPPTNPYSAFPQWASAPTQMPVPGNLMNHSGLSTQYMPNFMLTSGPDIPAITSASSAVVPSYNGPMGSQFNPEVPVFKPAMLGTQSAFSSMIPSVQTSNGTISVMGYGSIGDKSNYGIPDIKPSFKPWESAGY